MTNLGAIARGSLHACEVVIGSPQPIGIISQNPSCVVYPPFEGPGYIAGHIYMDSSESKPVAGQLVYLLCRGPYNYGRYTLTDASGYYEFPNLALQMRFIVVTPGYNNTVNGLVADDIAPATS